MPLYSAAALLLLAREVTMTNNVLLDAVKHKNLRVSTGYTPSFGDNEMSAITFPHEFRSIQADYPIFFKKDQNTGDFFPVALLGLRNQENLYLSESGWDAFYIPASVRRRPFLIGQTSQPDINKDNAGSKVYLDIDSPRISNHNGEAIFLEHGGYSPYLSSILELLEFIQYGIDLNSAFSTMLAEIQLLEVINLEITLTDGQCLTLAGFYTINEEKLASLSSDIIAPLHAKGYLQYLHMVIASHSNVAKIVKLAEAKIRSMTTNNK